MTEQKHPILVVGASCEEIVPLLPFAQPIAEKSGSQVIAVGLVSIPHDASLSAGALEARRLRQKLHACTHHARARTTICVGHNVWRELNQIIKRTDSSVVLINTKYLPPQDQIRDLQCDLAFIKSPMPSRIHRILLPIRGGPYAAMALRLALVFADAFQAEITVMRAVAPDREKNPIVSKSGFSSKKLEASYAMG